ncbi:hypothetical protein DHEL01_v206538 [Diaporthe helianthi]|uniref:Cyclohexanone monooxygenase n=1 Tax=Diaporthe helianthi TaxID=158607 RepID=A0A2P5HXV6_DIAHE|nr:hypothetical protein DHEL01_v206538 [Diaporthe helianthi]
MGSVLRVAETVEVLILGSGLSGLCSLYHIRQRFPDWRVRVVERAPDVGGTWFYNRYPGCRVDTESLSYCFSFDKELLQEWHWKETFSAQDEVHKYIRRFAEKNELHKHVDFSTSVKSASWDNTKNTWSVYAEDGREYTANFIVSCIGFLSEPTLPAIPDIELFQGESFHTSRWPEETDLDRDFAGKRVGVIGTGATGIQITTALSKVSGISSLSVFQRTANWSAPLRNEPISVEKMAEHAKNYDELFALCASTPTGFMHKPDPRRSDDLSEQERLAHWEKIYAAPGFSKWIGVFSDTYTSPSANKAYSDFIASKIRGRVNDPNTAESLIPKDHGFGTRRVPLESGYFESFNLPHVHLVDLKKTPISNVTRTGIETADGKEHSLDVLIYATGFDAITGAYRAIDWRGRDGRSLVGISGTPEGDRSVWRDHRPHTYLGLTVPSMPNLVTVMGPHQPVGNAARNIEHSVQVAVGLLRHCELNGFARFEATEEAADEWTRHVIDCSKGSLINDIDSWMTGVNSNVKGKNVRMVARYSGPVQEYRRRCSEAREAGFPGLAFA